MARKDIMLCYPFEEKRLEKWSVEQVIVQPKLDGDRCRAVTMDDGVVHLYSSEGNEINHVPHINEALENLELSRCEIDGELYVHGMEHYDIHSITSRKKNIHNDFEKMQFHAFDLVNDQPQAKRIVQLYEIKNILTKHELSHESPIQFVKSFPTNATGRNIMAYLEEFKKDGYEGIIIRHPLASYKRQRAATIMKFKPKQDDFYEIIGWKEEIDKNGNSKNRLGALICAGDDGTQFSVGSGLTDTQREVLWSNPTKLLMGNWAHVQYQHISSKGHVPRFPVLVNVVENPF